jgi:hypothetical protein
VPQDAAGWMIAVRIGHGEPLRGVERQGCEPEGRDCPEEGSGERCVKKATTRSPLPAKTA